MSPAACWFLTLLIFQPRSWRRHIPPNRLFTFNGLHGVLSQKIELFLTYTLIISLNQSVEVRKNCIHIGKQSYSINQSVNRSFVWLKWLNEFMSSLLYELDRMTQFNSEHLPEYYTLTTRDRSVTSGSHHGRNNSVIARSPDACLSVT
jgi:hypothetical protein